MRPGRRTSRACTCSAPTRTSREIAALAAVLGEPTGLDGLLGDLKYAVRPARVVPRLLGRAVREAYRWDDYDERDERW